MEQAQRPVRIVRRVMVGQCGHCFGKDPSGHARRGGEPLLRLLAPPGRGEQLRDGRGATGPVEVHRAAAPRRCERGPGRRGPAVARPSLGEGP